MATRRIRIKGILKIPPRRVANEESRETTPPQVEEVKTNEEKSTTETVTKPCEEIVQKSVDVNKNHSEPNNENLKITAATENHEIETEVAVEIKSNTVIVQDSNKSQENNNIVAVNSLSSEKILNTDSNAQVESAKQAQCSNLNIVKPEKLDDNAKIKQNQRPVLSLSINPDLIKNNVEHEIPPLASPTKMLNWRKKIIPKFGHQRRISFSIHGSASESEDDSKRTQFNRVRNDSVCSVASIASTHVSMAESDCKKGFDRKVRRSSSRKMIEARREFIAKCDGGKPDRQKLTMLDLIFYNPTTNPMSEKKKRREDSISISGSSVKDLEAETEDNPPKNDVEPENEDSVPVPQIKIGANGEIIVDEKSLVIENQSTKINRNLLQTSEIVDGDSEVGVGYTRAKRPKEWTKSETIRFYNALNSIGTDFMLMCELFPKRNRKELKMKFKKEEKLNRQLVDKALTQPRQFDMEDLHKELNKELEELKRIEKMEEEKKKLKELRKRKKIVINGGIEGVKDENDEPKKKITKKPKKKRSTYNFVKGGILSLLNDSDDESVKSDLISKSDSDDLASGEDSEDEVIKINTKPTRSGRMPKVRKIEEMVLQPVLERKMKNTADSTKVPEEPKKKDSDKTDKKIEPGSIMIVSSKGPTGENIYQVYMVTQGQEKTQINLGPDIVQNLTQAANTQIPFPAQNILTFSTQTNAEAQEPVEENNVTIPEDGDLTLKTTVTNVQE